MIMTLLLSPIHIREETFPPRHDSSLKAGETLRNIITSHVTHIHHNPTRLIHFPYLPIAEPGLPTADIHMYYLISMTFPLFRHLHDFFCTILRLTEKKDRKLGYDSCSIMVFQPTPVFYGPIVHAKITLTCG